MPEFNAKILVESVEEYFQLGEQMKVVAGYNPFLFKRQMTAKEKIKAQVKIYKANINQTELKYKK